MKIIAPPLVTAILLAIVSTFIQTTALSAEVSARNTTSATEPVLDTGNISYATSWRITLDKQAESDGEIAFRIILKADALEATRISIAILKGTTKADLAKIIESTLKSKAPMGIKVERNTNDEISVSAKTDLSIIMDTNTIADLDIKLTKQKPSDD